MKQNLVTVFFLLLSALVSRAAGFPLWFFLFEQAEQPCNAFPGTCKSTWDHSCLQIELGRGTDKCGRSSKDEGRCQCKSKRV